MLNINLKMSKMEILALKKKLNKANAKLNRMMISKPFSKGQVKMLMGGKKVAWGKEDLANAFALRYFSKRSYLYMKNKMGIPLPRISTLRRYAAKLIFQKAYCTTL